LQCVAGECDMAIKEEKVKVQSAPEQRLERMPFPRDLLAGVCAGIAYHFGLPTKFVRWLFTAFVCGGTTVFICAWWEHELLWAFIGLASTGASVGVYGLFWKRFGQFERVPGDFSKVTGDGDLYPCGEKWLKELSRRRRNEYE